MLYTLRVFFFKSLLANDLSMEFAWEKITSGPCSVFWPISVLMVLIRPPISKSSSFFPKLLGLFRAHGLQIVSPSPSCWQDLSICLSFCFLDFLLCGQLGSQSPLLTDLFLSQNPRTFDSFLFSRIDTGLCIYHLLVSSSSSPSCRASLPVGLQGYILYRHRAVVCRFYLVVLPLLFHVKWFTGVCHKFVAISLAFSRMSGSSNLDNFRD